MNLTLEEVLDAAVQTYKELQQVGEWLGGRQQSQGDSICGPDQPPRWQGCSQAPVHLLELWPVRP